MAVILKNISCLALIFVSCGRGVQNGAMDVFLVKVVDKFLVLLRWFFEDECSLDIVATHPEVVMGLDRFLEATGRVVPNQNAG